MFPTSLHASSAMLYSSSLTGAAHASYRCSVFRVSSWLRCSSSSWCYLILQHVIWREFSNFVFVVALQYSKGETEIFLCGFITGTVEKCTSWGHLRTGSWECATQNFVLCTIRALMEYKRSRIKLPTKSHKCIEINLSQWTRGLRCGVTAFRMLGLRVRIPPGAGMCVVNVMCCQVEISASSWSLV